ncbi:MAG: hypothetical protein WC076_06005 [Terrimicrobiaceae bacterium]|jgi:hypothetical protein|nr:hypothetical protein [Terrimicrobiaceae bacterium]
MKTPLLLLVVVAVVSLTSGCTLTEKYARNDAAARSWLAANDKGPAKTNFEGVYYSPDWGTVALNQRGDKITGAIAHFHIKGLASGRSAYLLLVDDEWNEHAMILKRKNSEILEGAYSSCIPFSTEDALPVHLDKIVY